MCILGPLTGSNLIHNNVLVTGSTRSDRTFFKITLGPACNEQLNSRECACYKQYLL